MRKTTTSLVFAAALLMLGACGGEEGGTTDGGADSTASGDAAGDDSEPAEDAEPAEDSEPAGDLQAAVLTAEDLPEGVTITPMDLSNMDLSGMEDMVEGLTYEPAECGETDATAPMMKEGVESAGVTAMTADLSQNVAAVVYSNAEASDIDVLEDHVTTCGEVSMTGTIAGQPIDMTTRLSMAEAPDVDADEVIAFDLVTESADLPAQPTRIVYIIDGDYGISVIGSPDSTVFDLQAVATSALERKRDTLG